MTEQDDSSAPEVIAATLAVRHGSVGNRAGSYA